MGGIGVHSTYQTGLVLAGLMLLGVADRSIGSPSTEEITVGAG